MAEATPVTGGCLSGAVRYEAEAYLDLAYYCHCKICQKSSSQPFEIGVLTKSGSLRFTKGQPIYYASSDWGQRGSCGACGSGIDWRPRDPAETFGINVGVCSLDQPEAVKPYLHMFFDEKVPWFDVADDLPRTTGAEALGIYESWKEQIE
ncbi:MAG: GFA family protein [Pseudomonadota bacterium]